jgi:hypothetical protein
LCIILVFGYLNLNAQQLVKDIIPIGGYSFPTDLVNVNGTLFFIVNVGINGQVLWKSDGTGAGTGILWTCLKTKMVCESQRADHPM